MCFATRVDVDLCCGADQLCGGVQSGIEGAIHAMTSLFSLHVVFLVGVYYLLMLLMSLTILIMLYCCGM